MGLGHRGLTVFGALIAQVSNCDIIGLNSATPSRTGARFEGLPSADVTILQICYLTCRFFLQHLAAHFYFLFKSLNLKGLI